MFSYTELRGQSDKLHQTGTVQINTEYHTSRKPAWLVLLKLLGVTAMVAVGFAIALPPLLEFGRFPLWQCVAIAGGVMLVYTGIAFFVRPKPNTDNMGFVGGMGNDPFQYSDNINRMLWKAHCVLGPGRFTAETLLDLCVLFGLARGADASADVPVAAASNASKKQRSSTAASPPAPFSLDPTRPIAPLDPNRFAQSSAHYVASQIELDTQRFLTPKES